ncbi:MAG: winged helix-turn-helix domain-containing protein [Candidatus Levybacteria bacterium]|nr:winged helix-turn-helix domain-containing protein [Candidatus Levybacteria bacterium]
MEPTHFESLYPPDSRKEEIEKIISYIKSGNSAQVISLPGVGRSNVLRILAYNTKARTLHLGENQKWFHFVMLNFSEIKKRPLSDSTKYMFLELVDSLQERKMDEEYIFTKSILDECIKSGDELVIFQGFKKTIDYLCLQKELTIVLLFDKFEEYVGVVEPVFFENLKVLRDRAKYRFSTVFPLNRPLEETIGHDGLSTFYEFLVGNLVYLSLGDEKIRDFRLNYIKKSTGKNIEKEVLDEVFKLTGGLGKLWLVCVDACISEGVKKDIQDFLLSNTRVKSVLSEIWKSFTPFEQNLIANEKANESSHLVAVGLVKNNKFAAPLLEEFAKNELRNMKNEIKYDEATNEIKNGNIILSEGLTSSEFKLLKFMVTNPEKILERDEIITSVWGDQASTAGVTEQALDQLIFRVRKKIEENPNTPTHIQTVKGRGFKFST